VGYLCGGGAYVGRVGLRWIWKDSDLRWRLQKLIGCMAKCFACGHSCCFFRFGMRKVDDLMISNGFFALPIQGGNENKDTGDYFLLPDIRLN